MNTETQRIVPYMQTESFPSRSAIESRCQYSNEWNITGIYDTEKSATAAMVRRTKDATTRQRKVRATISRDALARIGGGV